MALVIMQGIKKSQMDGTERGMWLQGLKDEVGARI